MMIKSYNDDHNADYAYEYAEFKRTNFSTGDIDVAEVEISSQMMVIIMVSLIMIILLLTRMDRKTVTIKLVQDINYADNLREWIHWGWGWGWGERVGEGGGDERESGDNSIKILSLFWKEVYSKRKEFAPPEEQILSF